MLTSSELSLQFKSNKTNGTNILAPRISFYQMNPTAAP